MASAVMEEEILSGLPVADTKGEQLQPQTFWAQKQAPQHVPPPDHLQIPYKRLAEMASSSWVFPKTPKILTDMGTVQDR